MNSDNEPVCKPTSWWPTVLLVVLLGWLCLPAEAHAATRDRKKTTVPTGLTATPATCGQINLSWTASTDTGGSGLMGYKVYRNGVLFKTILAPATQTSDVELAATTRYSYAIMAIDKAGNKSAKTVEVTYSVDANTSTNARNGVLNIAGQLLLVTQAGVSMPCTYAISATGANVSAGTGSGTVNVTAGTGCNWTASSSAPGWFPERCEVDHVSQLTKMGISQPVKPMTAIASQRKQSANPCLK